MATEAKLFDLFGEFTARWPAAVQRQVGLVNLGAADPDLSLWLAALNNGTQLKNVRVGAAGDRASVEAQLSFDNAQAAYAGVPDAFPFVLASMPDVEFRIQTLVAPKFANLFASASDRGVELVLEGLPVEIRLPIALVEPPEAGPAEVAVGSFTPGNLDGLKVIYRRFQPTSVFVHVRLLMTEDNEFVVRPAVPINFSECLLSSLPVKALHDFSLIPAPTLARRNHEWIRHTVEPWLPKLIGPRDGLFALRSIDVDETTGPVKDLAEVLNRDSTRDPAAEFVLDDVVMPFYSLLIPRQVTVGVRRRVLQADDIKQVFAFSQAPVQVFFNRDPVFGFLIESLFYRSQPSEDLSTDLGLTFSAVIFWGEGKTAEHGFEVSLGENYTPLVGYRRNFSPDGLPAPGAGAPATINSLLHWKIAAIDIDIMGFRGGYSLGRAIGEKKGFGDCFEFTVDLFVSMPPTGGDSSFFRMRSLDGQVAKFALLGLGWRQGAFHFEGLALPDGVAIFFGPVKIIIEEFGLVAETGASYLSFSGGLGVELPSGFEGSLVFRRLRFRVSGNPNAPVFKLDGIFISLRVPPALRIEAGGYYTEKQVGPAAVKEFGLTGTVAFTLAAVEYMFSLDLIVGSLTSPAESFDYFMFQVAFRGSIPICWFELRGARVLFARNMQPKLQPANAEAYELRYYNWYKATNPISVPGDRRLAAWGPQRDSWALGVGVGASIAQLGKILELGVFVLVVDGSDENGLLVVAEALLLQNPEPVAFVAVQWDGKNDQFSMLIGVNLTPKKFCREVPAWIDKIAKLSGTLFICNKPVVVALGRLADTRTWLSLTFDFDLWVRFFVQFGMCFEYSEAPNGGKGFGLIARMEGTIGGGPLRVDFNAGIGFTFAVFNTGSNDYAVVIWIEAGLRIVLFFFLRFGISLRGEFRNVGENPARGEIRAEVRLETPWFLPDVTWTFEVTFGQLEPAGLGVASSALRSAMAVDSVRRKALPVHAERIDPNWTGDGVARTWSVNELRGMALGEAGRLARFAADANAKPIATDSSVSVEFSVSVNDLVGVGGAAAGLGNQKSGDLTLNYDLIGVAVRRRARFGSDKNWYTLQDKIELAADFSDPSGVDLSGSFAPQQLTMFWDKDVQIGGQTAAKKLLLNSKAPYDFQTKNPEVDEETVKDDPEWPCCGRDRKKPYPLHEVTFRTEPVGADVVGFRPFSASQSRFRFLQGAYAYPVNFGSVLPPGTVVGLIPLTRPGVAFRADLDEDAAVCFLRLFWSSGQAFLRLIAFDAGGNPVGTLDVTSGSDFQNVQIPLKGPARRLDARVIGSKAGGTAGTFILDRPAGVLAVDRAGYVGLRDYLDYLVGLEACDSAGDGFQNAYSGRGALAFLPNHEYEVATTTRITVAHPSKPSESVEVKEFVYFKTKGLPGLNAVEAVGEEVAPYVRSAYDGGRGVLYREEPVAVAFAEDFHVAVPLPLRPPGTSAERNTLMVMTLLVRPDVARGQGAPVTATAEDWVVAHRKFVFFDTIYPYKPILSAASTRGTGMVTADPFRLRLAAITQRPDARCPLPDPRRVVGTALVAPPQGEPDPLDPGKQLWPADQAFTATVRQAGAGFVDRPAFVPADLTAFDLALDAAAGGGAAWGVANGQIATSAGAERRFAIFGEPSWNHLTVTLSVTQLGAIAGVGVALPAGGVPSRGLFAVVQPAGGGRRVAIFRRLSGAQFDEVAQAALPAADPAAPILLTVTAFDDRLRAAVGETVVEVEREELREGRLCLLAQGACAFGSLQVAGLDIYRYPFRTGRYRSFAEHIGSFRAPIDVIAANAMGPGTTTGTVAGLYAATAGEIAGAMQPSADAGRRQALFDRWVRELGLPLRDEVERLALSRFPGGAQAEQFLLESPEPLDFTEEVKLVLERRDVIVQPPIWVPPGLGLADKVVKRKLRVREDLLRAVGTAPSIATAAKAPLLDVSHEDGAVHVRLDSGALPGGAAGPLLVVEAVDRGADRTLRVYATAGAGGRAGGEVTLRAQKADEIRLSPGASAVVADALAGLEEGAFALVRPGLKDVIDIFRPIFKWTPLPVTVFQDAPGLRAVILPIAGGSGQVLGAGSYRLRFALERWRWPTTDGPDDLNGYRRSATLPFTL